MSDGPENPDHAKPGALLRWLAHPLAMGMASAAAVGLAVGTLDDGFTFDDRVHRAIIGSSSPLLNGGPSDLFRTATGDPLQVGALMESGAFPWFTQPDLRVAFWRPLASASHALDYTLWPNSPWLMHLENVLLYGVLVLVAGWLLRRLMNPVWAAGAATFLYAVDEAHASAVGWIAARNGLLAAIVALAALGAHLSATAASSTRRRRLFMLLSAALFATALACGELALGAFGYLIACAATLDPRPLRARLVSLLPWLAVGLGWATAYRWMGFGVQGSGYYVDPLTDPGAFLWALSHNGPSLLVLSLGLPSAVVAWLNTVAWVRLLVPVVSVLLFTVAVGPVLRRDRTARFFGLGLLLSVVPLCGTMPQGRLLLLASVGGAGLVARLFVAVAEARDMHRVFRGATVVLAALMLFAHGVIAPLAFPYEASAKAREAEASRVAVDSARAAAPLSGRTLVLVRAPHAFSAAELLFDRQAGSGPDRVRALHVGPGPITITRSSPNLLSIHDRAGFLREPVSWIFHGLQHPFRPGMRVQLGDVAFEVVSVSSGGRPTTVLCRFEPEPEDPRWVWMTWRAGRFVPFALPAVGERVVVP